MSILMRVILCRDLDEDGFKHTAAISFLVLSAQQFLLPLFLQFPLLAEISGSFHNMAAEIYLCRSIFRITFLFTSPVQQDSNVVVSVASVMTGQAMEQVIHADTEIFEIGSEIISVSKINHSCLLKIVITAYHHITQIAHPC